MGPSERMRIWHRRTGAGFLGLFLVLHLVTSASALAGERAYSRVVVALQRSAIYPLVELLVLVPLAVHVAVGVALLRRGATDEQQSRYGDRRLWALQRAAGVALAAFLAVHLWELRVQRLAFGLEPEAFHTVLSAHLSSTWAGVPWLALLYVVGAGAAALHFGNGLFAASSSWGATDGGARRRVRVVTVALGFFLFVVGAATTLGFATGTRLLPLPAEDAASCGPPSR